MTKTCAKCRVEKLIAAFGANRSKRDGAGTYCVDCRRKSRKTEPKQRGYRLKYEYGITSGDYCRMFALQLGRCAICKQNRLNRYGNLDVDHDHATGKVRGLLCNSCNQMLGQAGDSATVLRAAVAYLGRNE